MTPTWEMANILKTSKSIKLLAKIKNVSFILWKKLNGLFGQPNVSFANIFYSIIYFYFVDGFHCCTQAFEFDIMIFAYFCFCCPCLSEIFFNMLLRQLSKGSLPIFSSRSFMVFWTTSKSLTHVHFSLFLYMVWESGPVSLISNYTTKL